MIKISMREFSRNIKKYVTLAQRGQKLTVMRRDQPLVEINPVDVNKPKKWSMKFPTVKLKGGGLASDAVSDLREERRL